MTFDKKYILPTSVILGLVIAFSLFGFNGFDSLVERKNLAAVTTSSGCDSIYTSSYCATVPYVMNLTEAEAVGALKSVGFSSVSVVYKLVSDTSYGRVFSINVAQGSKVVKTAAISISVSTNTTNPPSTTPPPAGGTVPASSLPVIDKLYVKYNKNSYPYRPEIYWSVNGPTGVRCTLKEGSNVASVINTNDFNTTARSSGFRILSNPDQVRTISLTCVKDTNSVTQQIVIPADLPSTTRTDGASPDNIPTLNSISISPNNRSVGVAGSLSWSMQCGGATSQCRCVLDGGNFKQKPVGRSGVETITTSNTSPVIYHVSCVNLNGNRRVSAVITDTPTTVATPVVDNTLPQITLFTVTPATRHPHEGAKLNWNTNTVVDKCYLQTINPDSSQTKRVLVATVGSQETNLDLVNILPFPTSWKPSATTTTTFWLDCWNKDNSKTVSQNINLVTKAYVAPLNPGQPGTPLPPPAPPAGFGIFGGGAYYLSNNTDIYASYDLKTPKKSEPQIRARLAEKIPVRKFTLLADASVPAFASVFQNLLAAVAVSLDKAVNNEVVVDIYKDGHGDILKAPTLKVPFWSDVKLVWQYPEDAMLDADGPVNFYDGLTLKNWCEYVVNVENDCKKQFPDSSTSRDICERSRINPSPQVWVGSDLDPSLNKWSGHVQLHGFKFKDCQKQFPGGQKDLNISPENPRRVVGIFSPLWTPSNASSAIQPHWPGQEGKPTRATNAQRFVKITGYKCEIAYDDIWSSIKDGKITDITEDSFRDWADYDSWDNFGLKFIGSFIQNNCTLFDKLDPRKCNSGDSQDIKVSMTEKQCEETTSWIKFIADESNLYIEDMSNPSPAEWPRLFGIIASESRSVLDDSKKYTDDNKAIGLSVKYSGGAHALILLKVKKIPTTNPNPNFAYTYNITTLDPNGPKVKDYDCRLKFGKMSRTDSNNSRFVLVCGSQTDSLGPFIPFGVSNLDLVDKFKQNCPWYSTDSFCLERTNTAQWLIDNYPNIDNFTDISNNLSYGGVCVGWSGFVLRVAYFGNFIGECPRPAN